MLKLSRVHIVIIVLFVAIVTLDAGLYWLFHSSISHRPHIILIVSDDMGWNDVGFHGSAQIPTPNIDALGYNGVILDRFYTQATCTPSRTALLTGQYPIRVGMQGTPIKAGEGRALPLDAVTMAQRMKSLGYRTHLVGKWHLGAGHKRDTPTFRGFDSHFGYWNGFVGYFDYVAEQELPTNTMLEGYDLWDGLTPVWDQYQGRYATDLFTEKALDVINSYESGDAPLFLMVAHLAAHTGRHGNELGVPSLQETNEKFPYISEPRRRAYADVVNILDDSIGQLVSKLSQKQMLDNAIVVYFSDNGAQTQGIYANSGSNWPLRGLKFTEFEGGVRGSGVLYSPLLKNRGYVHKQLMHISDWLPTLYHAAGGNSNDLGRIDGISQWESLSQDVPTARREILLNIDEVQGTWGILGEDGRFKLVNGSYSAGIYDGYYGDNGRNSAVPTYNLSQVLNSPTNRAIQKLGGKLNIERAEEMQNSLDLAPKFKRPNDTNDSSCAQSVCLFDLFEDPCETTNLADTRPDIVEVLLAKIRQFQSELVPQTNQVVDPGSDPAFYNGTWCPWLDRSCVKNHLAKSLL